MDNPVVSVIIPERNEENFISKCLDGVINQSYPIEEIEVLVVDGLSDDKTREIVEKYSKKNPQIKLLINEKKITPVARNIGIKNSRGKYIMFFDAHSVMQKDYIEKCVNYMNKNPDIDNLGGIIITKPRKKTLLGKVIAEVLSSRFGVGGSTFRTGSDKPKEVDTVPFGFYRKEVFDKIGLFNEKLIRNQDIDFNLRLKRAGGKIVLFPDIKLTYYSRSTLGGFIKNNYGNGFWVVYGSKFSKMPFSLRHLIPFLFVLYLFITGILSIFFPFLWVTFGITGILYIFVNSFYSFKIAREIYDWKVFHLSFVTFTSLHFFYGLGSIIGFMRLLFSSEKGNNK
jgi:glycosyltransferase involved in cell wall biosynthesis